MNKWTEIFLGFIFILAAVLVAFYFPNWLNSALVVLKGGLLWFVFLIGILLLMLGISELKG